MIRDIDLLIEQFDSLCRGPTGVLVNLVGSGHFDAAQSLTGSAWAHLSEYREKLVAYAKKLEAESAPEAEGEAT